MKVLKSLGSAAVLGGLSVVAVSAMADGGIDISTATAAITAAQTAVLAVLGAMVTMAGAVWGLRKIVRLFGR